MAAETNTTTKASANEDKRNALVYRGRSRELIHARLEQGNGGGWAQSTGNARSRIEMRKEICAAL